jgi:hypothetical protein
MLILLEVFSYIVFCYVALVLAEFWQQVTEPDQLFGKWQKVLDWLYEKYEATNAFGYELLYKALGGCFICSAMWTSIFIYPLYVSLATKVGLCTLLANSPFWYISFWFLAPALTLDFLRIKDKN